MITLIFTNGTCDYDDYITIFFETLKNHIEVSGYSMAIDLNGMKITKEEFDNILNNIKEAVKNNRILDAAIDERQKK